ncbi:MAG: CoA transferase [Chloroflexi bacterium]|nr:CoA transferase [Chloroflexota bacterium]
MSQRELEGVRVVEYGAWVNVAFGGKVMADLGATVVKVEPPDGDTPLRIHGAFPDDQPDLETSAPHLYLNANKRSVTLDPASPAGRALFLKLAAWTDVLLDGTQAGELRSLDLDYPALHKANPRLVMIALSSLGREGLYNDCKGYDLTSWHASGSSHLYQGEPGQAPLWGHWYNAAHWGGINAAAAALTALQARDRTGRGQYVDISEAETIAALHLAVEVSDFMQNGTIRVRIGVNGPPTHAPSTMRRCKDGWVYIAALAPHQWDNLIKVMGNPGWATSPLFKGNSRARAPYALEINELMTPWLESHTAQELFEMCQANGVPAAPISDIRQLYEQHHLRERGFFAEMDHPVAGRVSVPGPPFRISGDPWRIDRPAPLLGEHNAEVYCDILGLAAGDLPALRRAGVI